ncbi:MAG: helix-turn-helix domain-containing protein [Sulfuricellaceae bacterium]|jgi:transcriptional regulator with XRE-family HTH domain
MPDDEKQPQADSTGDKKEPWAKWKVKPELVPMIPFPGTPESGIGARIAYCRGQLDNLSVEALARYTKKFDQDGISRASIIRYESGDSLPGARELRVLSEALWVPVGWLLLGKVDTESTTEDERALLRMMKKVFGSSDPELDRMLRGFDEQSKNAEIEKRQRWIDEARKPQPRS